MVNGSCGAKKKWYKDSLQTYQQELVIFIHIIIALPPSFIESLKMGIPKLTSSFQNSTRFKSPNRNLFIPYLDYRNNVQGFIQGGGGGQKYSLEM